MAKDKEAPKKSTGDIIKDAVNYQGAQVFEGKGTENVMKGVAKAGLATTYGIEGPGDFKNYGYFAPWIKEHSVMQAVASNAIADKNYLQAEQIIRSNQYGQEINPKNAAIQGYVLEQNPDLKSAMDSASKAQEDLGKKVSDFVGGNTDDLAKRVQEEIKNY